MSIYRRLIVAVAAMGLATSVFAAEDAATTTTTTETTAAAPAEAAPAPSAEAAAPAATETTTTTTTTSADKLDLNKASVKDLMKLKGVSAAKAKAIVTYRKKHGDFKEVKGFKKLNEKKMQEIADQLTVG
jgi:competence ComEA-like helix-hairpin-helix protein